MKLSNVSMWLGAAMALAVPGFGTTASLAQPVHRIVAAEVLDLVRVNEQAKPAPPMRELSGLAWDNDEGRLIAVSDRGGVFSFTLDIEQGRIEAVVVSSAAAIQSPRRINAESVWVRNGDNRKQGDSEILVADERASNVAVVDLQGSIRSHITLPQALRDRRRYEEKSKGVEAMAWHSRHGLVAAPQRPLQGHAPSIHRIYASEGTVWAFIADRRGLSSVKAMESLGEGQLLVLEKVRTPAGDVSVLREIALAACSEVSPCDPPALALHHPEIDSRHNFEGLACIARDLCLLVTDDGKPGSAPGTLALVRLNYR